MKRYFDLTLAGRDWWGPFLGFLVLFWIAYIPQLLINRAGAVPGVYGGLLLLINLAFIVLMAIIQSVFTIVFMRIIAPKLSFGGAAFGFDGTIREYLGLNLGGILLSIITVSIYAPWYIRTIVDYLASHTSYKGARMQFLGTGGKLFKYFLLALYLPIIVVSVLLGMVFIMAILLRGDGRVGAGPQIAAALMVVVVFIILVPFIYLVYKWYVDVKWGGLTVRWRTSFWPSCGFILGQVLLTLITAGIYWPAAMLRSYRYFAGRTVFFRGEAEWGRLGFDGGLSRGFGLLWGQGLLSMVTLGIYVPWAYARVGRWIMSATSIEQAGGPA
jgi:uncharacterized membrane protein YjgN (DUF898 family)